LRVATAPLYGDVSKQHEYAVTRTGRTPRMFFFFSNRLGCLGSLLVSAAVTLVLLLLLGVINH
jgi:hypothetical protein